MPRPKKQEVITFKVDPALAHALQGVPNRSEFIRAALLAAIDHACPLCKGTGLLTPDQRRHWESFAKSHSIELCGDCAAVHLVCAAGQIAAHSSRDTHGE
ncbi:MAG: CopG family transcriptional regulator [Planctomycetota bacterium]